MYEIIENPKIMLAEEIDEKYYGKWVYIVNAEFTRNSKFLQGIPVVVGDAPFEGVEDGIYNEYEDDRYGSGYSHTLINNMNFISVLSKKITR